MGSRSGDRVALRPIAEISGDSLLPLPMQENPERYAALLQETILAPGSRFTLFSGSGRVGTMRSDTTFASSGFCTPTPIVEGVAELIPDASSASRFVAVSADATDALPYADFLTPNHSYEQRVASIELASSAISASGVTWPESVLETRVDMQAVALDGDADGAMAATFVYRDRLTVGPADAASAWSIFVLGTGGPNSYASAFRRVQRVGDDGKGVARFWEQADWDGDGENEILLQVFGESARWSAALDRRGGGWTTIFEDACGPGLP